MFRVFIGSWVDYRDIYYESSFWLGPCEVGAYLAPVGGVPDDGFPDDGQLKQKLETHVETVRESP